MRKLVIAVLAMLIPFTAWTAGCRQNSRQAAFPDGPEVKSLARASTVEEVRPTVPMIPAPIDPEVMQSPDQPTFARIRSVQDREARLAGQYAETPGLFVLPAEENDLASLMGPVMTPASPAMPLSSPIYEPLRVIPIGNPGEEPLPEPVPVALLASAAAPAPSPAMNEIWSRPVTPMTSAYGFMPPPVPADVSAMAPPAAVTVPMPSPVPAPAAPPGPGLGADPMFMPEAIPGIFTGGEEGPTAFIAPKTFIESAGDINPPPLLSAAPASAKAVGKAATPAEVLVAPAREVAPLPPPNLAALSSPSLFSEKVTALLLNADARQALSPLQPLEKMPEGKPEPAAVEEKAEKTELAEFGDFPALSPALFEVDGEMDSLEPMFMPKPPAEAFAAATSGIEARDVYRMDFWDNQRPQALPAKLDERREKDAPEAKPDVAPNLEGKAEKKAEPAVDGDAPESAETPQKVTLVPLKPMSPRALGLEKIDSSVEVPPITF